MNSYLATIQAKAQQLPLSQQAEVIKFIESLLGQEPAPASSELNTAAALVPPAPPPRHKLALDWIDAPDAEPETLTSVEMQHLATDWWIEGTEKVVNRP